MKYVALLRGINVGGRIIKMSELKLCFENLGFRDVSTVLQTGNVVFMTSQQSLADLKKHIEDAISNTFSYPAHVQVFPIDYLASAVRAYPFTDSDSNHHDYIVFFEDGLEKPAMVAAYIDKSLEQVQVGRGVIYWRVPKGLTLKSSFASILTKAPYKNAHTNRNIRTLQKILKYT